MIASCLCGQAAQPLVDGLLDSILKWELPNLHVKGWVTLKQSPDHQFHGRFDYYRFRGRELLRLTDGSVTLVVTSGTTGRLKYWSRGTNRCFGGIIGNSRDNGSIFNIPGYLVFSANIAILQGREPGFIVESVKRSGNDDLRITARVVHTTPFRHLQRFEFHLVRGHLSETRSATSYDYESDAKPHTFRARSRLSYEDYETWDNGFALPRKVFSRMESHLGPKPLVVEKSIQVEAIQLLPETTDIAKIASSLTKGLRTGRWPAPLEAGTVDVAHTLFRAMLQSIGGVLTLVTGFIGIVAWYWYHRWRRRGC